MQLDFKVNVKQLTDLFCMSGDLGGFFRERQTMQDGTSIHTAFLSGRKEREPSYEKEVAVSLTRSFCVGTRECSLEIGGRIDGFCRSQDALIIEEIKSGAIPPESKEWKGAHACQLLCYAYMYLSGEGLPGCELRLIYVNADAMPVLTLVRNVDCDELKPLFDAIIDRYLERLSDEILRVEKRDETIRALEFPFPGYRKGQREFAVNTYRAIKGKYRLFARAPTGTGKTMAVLYATLKAMPEKNGFKIFYLTSRTTQTQAPESALSMLRERGLFARSVAITAKAKACLKPEPICDPAVCEYARGYFDRINGCMRDMAGLDNLNRETITEYARKHTVCPFELSLDLALLSDCIVCDCNYLFDPRVFLKRFFMIAGSRYVFLVDEAHNLVDRSREMYSPVLEKSPFLELKRLVPKTAPLHAALSSCNAWFIAKRKLIGKSDFTSDSEIPKDLDCLIEKLVEEMESFLSENPGSPIRAKVLDLYFDLLFFRKGIGFSEDKNAKGSYVTTIEKSSADIRVKLLCLDTSGFIRQKTSLGIATVFFSASLLPESYFFKMFEGCAADRFLDLGSPFPRKNLALARIDSVSTRYRNREESHLPIAQFLLDIVTRFPANYIAYFPSFAYMEKIFGIMQESGCSIPLVCQQKKMSEEERAEFLSGFGDHGTRLGFAVMGGIFGEGIDLAGERLKGAVIVGVGLPQVTKERELIRTYYEQAFGDGFDYAYTYPGFGRVLQAAGRVIRTEHDTGIVVLIDDRFSQRRYLGLFPPEWKGMSIVKNREGFGKFLDGIPSTWFCSKEPGE